MNLRKWWYLFWTTLVIGGIVSLATGMVLLISDREFMSGMDAGGFLFNAVKMFGAGTMYSVVSQMGFFAYLTLNYIALAIFGRKGLWKAVQAIVTIVVLVDLVILPLIQFEEPYSAWYYLPVPLFLAIGAWIVGHYKVKATNSSAWIPTLFFIITATSLEAVPALRENSLAVALQVLLPLFACNAWQIMKLHVLLRKEES